MLGPRRTPAALLNVIRNMAAYVLKLYKEIRYGGQLGDFPEEMFSLPEPLTEIVKESVTLLHDETILQGTDLLLAQPNRPHVLVEKYKQCYERYSDSVFYSNLDFIRWVCICFVIAAQLCDQQFVEAPLIALDTMFEISVVHNKLDAFAEFGCNLS